MKSPPLRRLIPSLVSLLAGLCFVSSLDLRAEESSAPVYPIGEIPDQRIWYNIAGQELTFVVSAPTLGENPTITMTPDQNNLPAGPLSFDGATRTMRYVPAKTDETPFTVAFVAVGNGAPLLQQITITPLPPVPPDLESFGTGPNAPLPDDESRDYLTIEDVLDDTLVRFNTSDDAGIPTRSVTIIGKTVVFEDGHPNGLYERFNAQLNIRELTIYAETLIVRHPLDLPQTNVEIHAHEMRFEDPAGGSPVTLSTVPRIPYADAAPPAAGSAGFLTTSTAGHDAGDLRLYVRELFAPGAAKRFLLKGGNGRRASSGKNGTDAGEVGAVARNWSTPNGTYNLGSDFALAAWAAIDNGITDQYTPGKSTYDDRNGWTNLNGHASRGANYPGNATAGGKPGNPGNGGAFESSLDLSTLLDNTGGSAGTRAATAQGGRGVRVHKAGASPPYSAGELGTTGYVTKVTVTCSGFIGCSSYTTSISTKAITSTDGADAAAPVADIATGQPGDVTYLSADDLRWLTPQAMQVALNYLNDAYLDGHFDEVAADLVDYLQIFNIVMATPGWSLLAAETQVQLELIRDDMENLQHRLGSNLDYFGNPAGWVPMLSFEVNKLAFDDEINRALRVMYLNYWLGNRAQNLQDQLDALRALRVQLLAQIEKDRADYNDAVAAVPVMQVRAEEVQLRIDRMLERIREIEDELLPKAKSIVVLKKVARTMGKIAQMVPVYQPALGAAGGAVAASADIDPNKSWEENTILVGTGAAQGFAAGNALPKAQSAQQSINGINTNDPAANAGAEAALRAARDPLMQLMRDSHSAVTSTKTSDPEVAAELQRLLADVPEYRVLQRDLMKLNAEKRDFFAQLADLIQRITTTSLSISRNLRQVALLNQQISAGIEKLDPALLAYLHDMDSRARARLLKYHYYVARAYGYRRLEAYPGSLNLQLIFDKFVELADDGASEELNAAQFDSLKAVYQEQLSTVAEAILGDLNNSPPEQSQTIEVTLPADVIAQINAGETGRFNLKDTGLFSLSEENFRITNIQVSAMNVSYDSAAPAPAYADLVVRHSGRSELQRDGKGFLFRHYSERTRNAITWKARRQFSSGTITHSKPSAATASLIAALVPGTQDLLLYTRPAAFADLLLSLESNNQDSALTLHSVTLQVSYDYTDKADAIKSLRVIGAPNGVDPDITLSVDDRNGRSSGRGELERYYDLNTSVTVSVPAAVGDFVFDYWIGGGITNPAQASQTLVMNRHYQLTPVYRSTVNYSVQISGATGSGSYAVGDVVALVATPPPGATFLRWEGEGVQDPTALETELYVFENSSVSAVYSSIGSFRSAFVNISNRAQVGTGADILIPGFILSGSAPKNVLVRVVGPTIGAPPFNVGGVLANPTLKIYNGNTLVAENDDWGTNTNLAALNAATTSTGAFPLNANSADAAVLVSLAPGSYTVHAAGFGDTTGVALVELYDADPDNPASKFINVSGRAFVGTGSDVLIPGFSITGNEAKTVLVRAVGPTLGGAPYNVPGVLANPQLTVYQDQTVMGANDDWNSAVNAAEIRTTSASIGAFALQEGGGDAAVLITLQPGTYTAVVSGVGDTSGVALVEVYEVQ